MNTKKASSGMAVPGTMQNKTIQLNCSRNMEKRKAFYFKKYTAWVLLLLLVNHIGFWAGYFFAVLWL